MAKVEDSDDDDWFNKDDEELLKDLTIKVEQAKSKLKEGTEYVEDAVSYDEKYMQDWRLKVVKQTPENTPKIQTPDLRKLAKANVALDIFLYAFTVENSDFFHGQICANDSMERVILYVRLYAVIAELKVPGFHEKVITHFAQDEQLFDQLCMITTKMFTKRYKTLWKTDNDKARLDRFLGDIQLLLLQVYVLNALTPKAISTVKHIRHLLKTADFKEIIDRKVVKEFAENLKEIETKHVATEPELESSKESNDIYPKLYELFESHKVALDSAGVSSDMSLIDHVYKSVSEYLSIQKHALRNDFLLCLADCVKELKENQKLKSGLAAQVLLYEDVEIVLNENFANARRHEMLFVNIVPDSGRRKLTKSLKYELKSLKTGALFCLTTSYDFDNLIFALVTHQDNEFGENGYVAIEIVRQYNIGNVYNKKLIMFSSPAFFEPYHNVYKYLSTCSVDDFPMREIVVFNKQEIAPPTYLTAKTVYTFDNYKFKPLQDILPLAFPLNGSQREALHKAITQKFALIQGPPGTGKTHLSVQLVKLLLESETPKPILVVAYTNESLDKFLLKISTYTSSIARLGGQTRLAEITRFNIQGAVVNDHINWRLKRLYYNVNTEFKASFKELQTVQNEFDGTDEGYEKVLKAQNRVRIYAEQLNTIRIFFHYYVVRERSIVALTTTCAAKMNFLFRLLGCKIVILEEAAEILESHVLACLTPQTEHVIMIGDHMQLKPFTSNYQHSRSCDLNVALFERLINRGILNPAVLLTQYRMRPVIAKLMCPIFYDVLYNDDSVERYPLVRGMFENLFFVEHDVDEKKSLRKSYVNRFEAVQIINLANYLITKAKYETSEIVILSPYARQCEVFKGNLTGALKSIRVMTVDSFQGLEANIVLLSLVRSNQENQIGFLQEKNRVCVALSRAKYGLYIIGNLKMYAVLNETWRQIEHKLNTPRKLVGQSFPYAKKIENTIDIDDLIESL